MNTQEALEHWADSGLLDGTTDNKKGDLANLLNQTFEYMKNRTLDERVAPLIFPMVARLFNSNKEIGNLEKLIDKFIAEFSIKAENIYGDIYSSIDTELEFVISFVENFKP